MWRWSWGWRWARPAPSLDADGTDGSWQFPVLISTYEAADLIALVVGLRARGRVGLVAGLASAGVDRAGIPAPCHCHVREVGAWWKGPAVRPGCVLRAKPCLASPQSWPLALVRAQAARDHPMWVGHCLVRAGLRNVG